VAGAAGDNDAAGFGSETAEAAEGADIDDDDAEPSDENLDDIAQKDKAEIMDKKCVDTDSSPTRKKWCEID